MVSRIAALLSHTLSIQTPAYGGKEGLRIRSVSAIVRGDTANSVELQLPNHIGTHVDAPRHFFDGAASVSDIPIQSWMFRSPWLVDIDVQTNTLIEELPCVPPSGTDLLLIRTGHQAFRGREEYWAGGPGLGPRLATYIRTECPSVRAVGVDLISITSPLHREAGRAAHREFLRSDSAGMPILLIEDMALSDLPQALGTVLVSPMLIEGVDGAPVTVWSLA